MSALDLTWIRAQFPALMQEMNGRPVVFFDGPGGTQVPRRVIDAMAEYLTLYNSNTHGAFATSQRTDATVDAARVAMADFLGCDADEVVFGPNMTTLTFAISRAFGRDIRPGDEIVVTRLDHDANVAPWQALEERGAIIRMVDIDVEDCTLDMADMARAINSRTKLVAVGYASNAVGTINDVATITRMAHDVGALVYIDAVHYAPHGPIDVRALDCDFLACSPYKFFAPHMGALYGKREHLERLRPYKVRPASDAVPDRWETGTKNHEGLAGVTAAIDYLAELGRRVKPTTTRRAALVQAMEAIQAYERTLSHHLIAGLLAIPGLTFYGISDPARFAWRTPTVAVRLEGSTPRELARRLGDQGIFCWDGNYYAINLTERLGVEADGGMLRIGLVHYNTAEEIDRLLEVMRG
ncbi:cysteine desulfurase-like protein [Roseiflexus castenholzii]|jgi:cysteine desulfurase family protein (TIGR01976 family)|uniref:Cysteine desulfurase family protein n=1 Tax=Roseiflexus castenholzii (strain DSM 13941 / HLO8) TaxID=383372 RepID=A7NN97_ROSCS|nr:cysteine desulfurase-like protein [Roseiflexus castenholzii]ABU59030.1 cysteine desulfurase family protein [Roseiflexus castenholzii DSM 13941]